MIEKEDNLQFFSIDIMTNDYFQLQYLYFHNPSPATSTGEVYSPVGCGLIKKQMMKRTINEPA